MTDGGGLGVVSKGFLGVCLGGFLEDVWGLFGGSTHGLISSF